MVKYLILSFFLLVASCGDKNEEIISSVENSYVSYFTGSAVNINTNPLGGTCLMGGATENDQAMEWFLKRANGGDILVLRTSGSDGYNDYMYAELGCEVNSVETIVCRNADCSKSEYVLDKISRAEAIWFAGGDQWKYIQFWRNTEIEGAIDQAIRDRNIAIGGTSAGMAILGGHYFSAMNGTITSDEVLANPYNAKSTIQDEDFLDVDFMDDVLTDTHYDNPDRRGRHAAFIATTLQDQGITLKGVACEEYTAICIDENGIACVFGNYPAEQDYAYFIQVNPNVENNLPEQCVAGEALTWDRDDSAILVYKVPGTTNGSNQINLSEWPTDENEWSRHWYVEEGILRVRP